MRTTKTAMNQLCRLVFSTILLLTGSSTISVAAAVDPKALFAKFDGPSRPAAVFVVVQGGQLISSGAFGTANFETMTPANLDSVFEIGSVAKMFTAYLVERLIADGKISADDDVRTFLPDLPIYARYGIQVNVT
jgi:CubicO group peptidase (beta-lactamase class C family)